MFFLFSTPRRGKKEWMWKRVKWEMMKHQQVGELTEIEKLKQSFIKWKEKSCWGNIFKCCGPNSPCLLPSEDWMYLISEDSWQCLKLLKLPGRQKYTAQKKLYTLAENHSGFDSFPNSHHRTCCDKMYSGILNVCLRWKSCVPLHATDSGKVLRSLLCTIFAFMARN